jgi:hypothetical protein
MHTHIHFFLSDFREISYLELCNPKNECGTTREIAHCEGAQISTTYIFVTCLALTEKYAGFWQESPKEGDRLKDRDIDGRMRLECILGREAGGGVWSGFNLLGLGTGGGLW